MTTKAMDKGITKELLDLETGYWQALKDHDFDAAVRNMDDEVITSMPTGVEVITPQGLKQMMKPMDYKLTSFKIGSEPKARQINDNTALFAYELHRDLTMDGRDQKIDTSEASVWVRRSGRWVCTMHAETPFSDVSGRKTIK